MLEVYLVRLPAQRHSRLRVMTLEGVLDDARDVGLVRLELAGELHRPHATNTATDTTGCGFRRFAGIKIFVGSLFMLCKSP